MSPAYMVSRAAPRLYSCNISRRLLYSMARDGGEAGGIGTIAVVAPAALLWPKARRLGRLNEAER